MSSLQLGVLGESLVSQGTGYGLLIGLGVAFCGVILGAVKIQKAYLAEDSGKSEMFMVANRSVGKGLTAAAVFSSWMWINETVFSASMCYRYGLAVPLVCMNRTTDVLLLTPYIVVGFWTLFSDCAYGRTGCVGKDSCALCSHFTGDHSNEVWQNWPCRLHRLESVLQHLRMRFHDSHRIPTYIWYLRDALCGCNVSDSSGR